MNTEEQLTLANESCDLSRFFYSTQQTVFLFDCIEESISRDLKQQLDFLKFFDAAMKSVMGIVDMPNQRAGLLIRLIHQNKGKLSQGKRDSFSELSDEEIHKIEAAIKAASEQFQSSAVQ